MAPTPKAPASSPASTTVANAPLPKTLQSFLSRAAARHLNTNDRLALVTEYFALPKAMLENEPFAARALREGLGKTLQRDPALQASFSMALAERFRRADPALTVHDDLGADLLTQLDRETGSPLAALIKLRILGQLQRALSTELADTPWAWTERSHQQVMVGRAVADGDAQLTPAATKKLETDLAALMAARQHDNNEARTHADSWVAYLLKPETTQALRHAPEDATAEALLPGLQAINELNRRLSTTGQTLAGREQLGAALRLTVTQLATPQLPPTFPQLVSLFAEPRAPKTINGPAAHASIDELANTDLKATVTGLSKANWGLGALTVSLLGVTEALEVLVTPEMTFAEARALHRVFNRTKEVVTKAGYHTTHPDGALAMPLKRFAAALAATNTLYAFADYKADKIGTPELSMRVGFYTAEILDWAAATGYGQKLIGVPLEKSFTLAAKRLLQGSKLATKLGASAAENIIPVLGCLLASGATYFEYERAHAAGDTDEARARLAETLGWGAMGIGTAVKATAAVMGMAAIEGGAATSATGVGVPVGLTLMVVGGVLVVGATCYDFFYAPNEMEKLAETLGYAHD